jgi:predicted Zn-dependent protease
VLALGSLTLVSVSDEISLGREAQRQLRAKTPHIGGSVESYVARVGKQLASKAEGPRYPYSFSVADAREINALALPGGPVWINRGALEAASNESEMAGVLAHEIAHIARRHAAAQISKEIVANGLLGLLGAVLGNAGGASTAQAGAQALAGGYLMTFTRDDERDADRVALAIMRLAGWDPRGLLAFLTTLRQRSGRDPSAVEVFFSTHPSPADRIATLRALLTHTKVDGRRDSPAFHTMRKELSKIRKR